MIIMNEFLVFDTIKIVTHVPISKHWINQPLQLILICRMKEL